MALLGELHGVVHDVEQDLKKCEGRYGLGEEEEEEKERGGRTARKGEGEAKGIRKTGKVRMNPHWPFAPAGASEHLP